MTIKSTAIPTWISTPLLLTLSLTLQFCGSAKKTTAIAEAAPDAPKVSYATQIKPIIVEKCSPCHFPETGKKIMLDTYEAVRDNAKDILRRVQLPQDHMGFMPFKNKKAPLTEAEIQLLKDWVAGQMQG